MAKKAKPNTSIGDAALIAVLQQIEAEESREARQARAWSWVEAVAARVRRRALSLLPHGEDLDAAQDVLVGLMQKARDRRFTPAHIRRPGPWLHKTVGNMLRDRARIVRRRLQHFELAADPEDLTRAVEMIEDVHDAPSAWRSWGMGPIDGLVLVALEAPELVEPADIVAAVNASLPPRIGLTRDAEHTWRLFQRWRSSSPRSDRELYFIFRGPAGSVFSGAWTERDALRARAWAQQRIHRARVAARAARDGRSVPAVRSQGSTTLR